MIKVDTHFHPNFSICSKWATKKRAEAIWKSFQRIGLDMVIVTEHAFRQPEKQYKLLKDHMPTGSKTRLIPGVESLTKEGIDMIVFSESEDIFQIQEVMSPKFFTFFELVDFVSKRDDLYCIITHPFNTSDTAIIWHYDEKKLKEAVKASGFIEKHNACWYSIQCIFKKLKLNFVVKSLYKRMEYTSTVPEKYYFKDTIIMGGSDAHHPKYLGDYLILHTDKNSFSSLVDKKIKRSFHYKEKRENIFLYIIRNCVTISIEGVQKRLGLYKKHKKKDD